MLILSISSQIISTIMGTAAAELLVNLLVGFVPEGQIVLLVVL